MRRVMFDRRGILKALLGQNLQGPENQLRVFHIPDAMNDKTMHEKLLTRWIFLEQGAVLVGLRSRKDRGS